MSRIAKMQKAMEKEGLDGVLIEDPLDLFYLTSVSLSSGLLLLTKTEGLLLIDGRYIEAAQKKSSVPSSLFSPSAVLDFFSLGAAKQIGFDGDKMTFARVEEHKKKDGSLVLVPWNGMTKKLRACKDAEEVASLQASADLLFRGYEYIKGILCEGIKEKELALAFTLFCLQEGAEKLAFDPIVAFGASSAMPHHRAGDTRLQAEDVVLLDLGVVVQGYHSDMTRMIIPEKGDSLMQEWLRIVLQAQSAALALCRPGTTVGSLDEAARAVFKEHGVEEYFLHSLGHGVGLEIHEYPRIRAKGVDAEVILEPGMAITIEPGLYKPGRGGVRYEDTIVITEEGYRNLFEKGAYRT